MDDPDISGVTNRLALPFSAHFQRELLGVKNQLASFINGTDENTFRPHSLTPETKVVSSNHTCILDTHQKDFQTDAVWGCPDNETCEKGRRFRCRISLWTVYATSRRLTLWTNM